MKAKEQAVKRELDIGGDKRLAIMPLNILSQMEAVTRAGLENLPPDCQRRQRREQAINRKQTVKQQCRRCMHPTVGGDGGIQVPWIRVNCRDQRRGIVFATFNGTRATRCDECEPEESSDTPTGVHGRVSEEGHA